MTGIRKRYQVRTLPSGDIAIRDRQSGLSALYDSCGNYKQGDLTALLPVEVLFAKPSQEQTAKDAKADQDYVNSIDL